MVCNRKVSVFFYDDILEHEYREYLTYVKHKNNLYLKTHRNEVSMPVDQKGAAPEQGNATNSAPVEGGGTDLNVITEQQGEACDSEESTTEKK